MFNAEDKPSGLMRWLPAMVVVGVLAGFVTLSWYAYHAGTQSVKDEDLLVVEADKTPVKEKPVDAGGMQFPNQDKTIFETFGNAKQPPKVERVLPTPEEPVTTADNSGTTGWINDDSKKPADNNNAKAEQVISPANSATEKEPKKPVAPIVVTEKPPEPENTTVTYVAKPQPKPAETPAVATPKEEKKLAKKEVAKPAESPAPADTNATLQVQLGAYRSEEEGQQSWSAMRRKHAELLGDISPNFIKADLGSKGIYYRLRIGAFADAAEAKAFCKKLTAVRQDCILPVGK